MTAGRRQLSAEAQQAVDRASPQWTVDRAAAEAAKRVQSTGDRRVGRWWLEGRQRASAEILAQLILDGADADRVRWEAEVVLGLGRLMDEGVNSWGISCT